ncbi:DegT/DnrJ/EryC1/StrS family aminotransferase [Cecembia rubra]|uniref:GDP-perosamine synthase n=1 Tax=Cecembia rubra TaxID=1485585 RepID=A0A2P8E3C7_9BACT|nr:DegT/DnrJ/EryC1/StrS family aminotransferase [Cecembia rubra]PSL03973.1 dTDP-4-amino-4,6-dideoxygalactose transaminase [Cecembia rubra]
MNNNKIWLSSPHMGGNEKKYINEAFELNWIAPVGHNLNQFEKALEDYTQCGHALALNSGTAALHLSMILLGVQPGDYVICQSLTFCASANPVKYLGGIPVFVDSEKDTWNMCPEAMEKAIQACLDGSIADSFPSVKELTKTFARKPKAIIPVHLYGMPAKMKEIKAIADKYGIPVLEDAAEAVGSELYGEKCGTFGEIGVLSFNGNKIITTSGGGAILSQNKAYIERAKFLATQAKENTPHYEHKEIGFNYRLSNVLAGIGRGQLEVLPERIQRRRKVHDFYLDALGGMEGITFLKEPYGYLSNRWLTCVLVDREKTGGVGPQEIIQYLAADQIEARPLWKPMHLQESFEGAPFFGGYIAEQLFDQGLCLPSGSNMTDEDLERVVFRVKECLDVKLKKAV